MNSTTLSVSESLIRQGPVEEPIYMNCSTRPSLVPFQNTARKETHRYRWEKSLMRPLHLNVIHDGSLMRKQVQH